MSYKDIEKTGYTLTPEMHQEVEGIIVGCSLILGGLALMAYADELHSHIASYAGLGIDILGFSGTVKHIYSLVRQTVDIF